MERGSFLTHLLQPLAVSYSAKHTLKALALAVPSAWNALPADITWLAPQPSSGHGSNAHFELRFLPSGTLPSSFLCNIFHPNAYHTVLNILLV